MSFRIGQRVELRSSTQWARSGLIYGTVTAVEPSWVHVLLDISNKTVVVQPSNLLHVEHPQPGSWRKTAKPVMVEGRSRKHRLYFDRLGRNLDAKINP